MSETTTKPNIQDQTSTQNPSAEQKIELEKELLGWKAASRPFKRRDKQFWTTIIAIAAIFGLILFLVEGVMPVILIISIIFLYYVLSTVEPENIEYSITNKGVKIANQRTDWEYLTKFWFTRRHDSELLVFEMNILPGRLELVISPKDKEKIKTLLTTYLKEEESPPSNIDRAANYFSRFLPQGKFSLKIFEFKFGKIQLCFSL